MQNFLSAATGIVVVDRAASAASRAHSAKTIGNVWVDITRITLYVLLPMSIAAGDALQVQQGVHPELRRPTCTRDDARAAAWQAPKLDAAGQPVQDAEGDR